MVLKKLSIISCGVLAALLVLASCGGEATEDASGNGDTTTTTTTSSTKLLITAVDMANNRVKLINFTSAAINVASYFLCARFTYELISSSTILSGSTTIESGGELSVQTSMDLNNDSSDLGLYSSSDFASSDAMVDFVQWGAGGGGREGVAVAKVLWTAGDFVAAAPDGQAILRDTTTDDTGVTVWSVGTSPF